MAPGRKGQQCEGERFNWSSRLCCEDSKRAPKRLDAPTAFRISKVIG